jgi:basic membrane lipoprotein Med (substrate-binding protein (PBP1-ABC) superfamily)
MFKRVVGLTIGALVAVGMLSGCTPEVVSATPTPVDYKACMLSDVGGFSDGGLNQSAYYALQQAKVQFGVHRRFSRWSTDWFRAIATLFLASARTLAMRS